MKIIFLNILLVTVCLITRAQVNQFPQVYYNNQGTGGSNLNIRSSANLSASIITSLSTTSKIGAESLDSHSGSNGTEYWIKVCLPTTSTSIVYGYMLLGQYNARINETNNYANVIGAPSGLKIRMQAGSTSSEVTIGGSPAKYANNSIVSLTGTTSVVSGVTWYQLYLSNNCSQLKGYVSGDYLSLNSNTQNYYNVGGTITNSSGNSIWGAEIKMGSSPILNAYSSEGFYEFKLAKNWSGNITCSHTNYTNSAPTSYSYTATSHKYNKDFVLSNTQQTGSVKVTLSPIDAINSGAQWAIDNQSWNNSGVKVDNISVGNHTINFKTIVGWTIPNNKSIVVTSGQTTNETGNYTLNNSATISISGDLNFGNINIGSTIQKKITISNTGNISLNITNVITPVGFSSTWTNGQILAGSTKEIDIQFKPLNASAYNGNIQIISNATNGNSTIQCSGVGINNFPPSDFNISCVIDNNSSFNKPILLWSGLTNQQPIQPIKICADGSKVTKVKLINNSGVNSNNIRFLIKSDPLGNNSDYTGYFINYKVNGNIITAEFVHPKYVTLSYKSLSRADTILICDYTNTSSMIFLCPIRIYRAPVLMLHGLWGKPSVFEALEDSLWRNNYLNVLTLRVDYFSQSGAELYTNKLVVPKSTTLLLKMATNSGYSTGKVDVVAHSMGGVLARKYIQGDNFKSRNDISKLITINTPHSGSQAANLLTHSLVVCESLWAKIFISIHVNVELGIKNGGAPADLAVNSDEMKDLNIDKLNNSVVPSHCIVTSSSFPPAEGSLGDLYSRIADKCNKNVNTFIDYLFFTSPNDLIVAEESQNGGLQNGKASYFTGQQHLGSPRNLQVIQKVREGLSIKPDDQLFFSQDGFHPNTISTHYRNFIDTNSTLTIINNAVQINTPITGQVYLAGQNLPISFTSSSAITNVDVRVYFNENDSVVSFNLLQPNDSKNIILPSSAFGRVVVTAIGYNNQGLVSIDTAIIKINTFKNIDSVKYYPDTLFIEKNNVSSIELKGYFQNSVYNLDMDDEVNFLINDTTIVKRQGINIFNGIKVGHTSIDLSYKGITKTIPVIVFNEDTTLIQTGANMQRLEEKSNGELLIIPNPNNGKYHVFVNDIKYLEEIKLINLLGETIMTITNFDCINEQISVDLPNGTYYMIGRNKTQFFRGKLLLIKE